jgi:microcystin degradation protein MlrC
MRIGIIGFQHESNSFMPASTDRAVFEECRYDAGEAIFENWRDSHHEIAGFIEGAAKFDYEPVPLLAAVAMPCGPLTAEAYEEITGEIIASIRAAEKLDGILLGLHGAMVAVKYPDADGQTASLVRKAVGPDLPVVMTLDLHANVSHKMIESTTAAVYYRSNPHLDQRQRGLEAAEIVARTVRGEISPVQAVETPPMTMNILKQYTDHEPAATLFRNVEEVMKRDKIISASVTMGFAYSDVEKMGPSFLAVADGDAQAAKEAAAWMAQQAWDNRKEFVGGAPSPEEAIRQAAASEKQPITLFDVGDNVGGGSPGDSTFLFAEIIKQGVKNSMVVLYDPESVQKCVDTGIGQDVSLSVGGKSDDRHGQPVQITGRIRTISDGFYIEDEARHGGRRFNDQGVTVVVETPEEHTVVLTSLRMPPMSLEQVLSVGVKPQRKKILIAKGVVAPRAAYQPVSAEIVLVDTPGASSANPTNFEFHNRRRPLYPFEEDAEYSPTAG